MTVLPFAQGFACGVVIIAVTEAEEDEFADMLAEKLMRDHARSSGGGGDEYEDVDDDAFSYSSDEFEGAAGGAGRDSGDDDDGASIDTNASQEHGEDDEDGFEIPDDEDDSDGDDGLDDGGDNEGQLCSSLRCAFRSRLNDLCALRVSSSQMMMTTTTGWKLVFSELTSMA